MSDNSQGIEGMLGSCSVDLGQVSGTVYTQMASESKSDKSSDGSDESDESSDGSDESDANSFYWNPTERDEDICSDEDEDDFMGHNDMDYYPTDLDGFFNIPQSLKDLKVDLLVDYTLPAEPPALLKKSILSPLETASLKHYVAWKKSNGTIQAFNLHREVLTSTSGLKILSLYKAQKLAIKLTDFHANMVDMCPNSCIAYTGQYRDLEKCPFHIKSLGVNKICDSPRYKYGLSETKKPRAQVQILPVMSTIRAMFHNADTAKLLRHRDSCLQQALHLVGTTLQTYSDYGDSNMHAMQHNDMGLFNDPRDIAFALSTDGAQLTMKKHSNTWLLILIILNYTV